MNTYNEKTWHTIEAPLIEIDAMLAELAKKHGMEFGRNYHNWPNRFLSWQSKDGINRKFEITLSRESIFKIYGYAWKDNSNGKRAIKIVTFSENVKAPLASLSKVDILAFLSEIEKINDEQLEIK